MEGRELLKLAWDWALRQRELLKTILPVMMEMKSCLIEDRKPTPEQVGRWTTLQSQVTQKMLELNANVDQLRRAIDPLF
jgi:hemolysin-activating ACP:hemolysin acyltransferase